MEHNLSVMKEEMQIKILWDGISLPIILNISFQAGNTRSDVDKDVEKVFSILLVEVETGTIAYLIFTT